MPEARLLACLDGRIDDLGSLRGELGCESGAPAALVLLSGYARLGFDLLQRLRGDYAFVIWDGHAETVLAARDPLGIRPLYYVPQSGRFLVASDSAQFVSSGAVSTAPDDRMVVEFLTRRVSSRDRSFFRDVKRLPAGHVLVATKGTARITEYRRRPSSALTFSSSRDCLEGVRERLEVAVRRALPTDERAIVELSGGIDSTSIVCLTNQILGEDRRGDVIAAAGLHPGLPCDESVYVREVEKAVRLPVVTWDATVVDRRDLAEPLMAMPGASSAMTGGSNGVLEIAKARDARILLIGTGGDQVGEPLGIPFDQMRAGLWKEALGDFFDPQVTMEGRVRFLRWSLNYTAPAWLRGLRRITRPLLAPSWLTMEASVLFREADAEALAESDLSLRRDFVSVGQHLRWQSVTRPVLSLSIDLKQYFASAHGLEMRFPFLDWDLICFVLAVPHQYWPKASGHGRIHREALESVLPAGIHARRSKAEFTSALDNRGRAQLAVISDLVEGTTWASARYVSQNAARRLLSSFRSTTVPDLSQAHAVWAIAALEAWLRRFLSYSPGAPF